MNECTTNDKDLIDAYNIGSRKSGASFDPNEPEFNAHVFVVNSQKPKSDKEADGNKHSIDNEEELIVKRQKQEQIKKEIEENYFELAAFYNQELNENTCYFDCDICLEDGIEPHQGVVLKECLHVFCKECLKNHIKHSDDPVKCPYSKEYNCPYFIQDREVRALLSQDDYAKFQLNSLRKSEAAMENTFHCKTPDCIGFCVFEDGLNFFDCKFYYFYKIKKNFS